MRIRHARDEIIGTEYLCGRTIAAIARDFGIGQATAWRSIDALGIARRQGPHAKEQTITIPADIGVLAYTAGLFDGEGNLNWRRRTGRANSARIAIYSTTIAVIDWLQLTFDGGSIRWDHKRTERHGWKPIGAWEINRLRDTIAFLDATFPYLIIKRDQATAALIEMRRYFDG